MGKIEKLKNENSLTKKFFVKVYGCQYNEWDATRLSFALKKMGFTETDEKSADIVFVLNCSVRKSAVDRALGKIRNWQNKKVIVAGCLLPKDRPRFLAKNVILWDINNVEELGKVLDLPARKIVQYLSKGQQFSNYIPIIKGCNNFCSYCAVPYVRGREISRPINEIISDIRKVLKTGTKEITLLGQNVNSYEFDFVKLLEEINSLDGNFTVSFTSNHPKDMSDEIIEAIATLPKIAKSIHLPLQSGSDKILKAMNRPYNSRQYLALVAKMKKIIPDLILTSDVIVGFPGETEKDFEKTADILRKTKFTNVYINKYSPREGTAAWKLGDPISWIEKECRWRVLDKIVREKRD